MVNKFDNEDISISIEEVVDFADESMFVPGHKGDAFEDTSFLSRPISINVLDTSTPIDTSPADDSTSLDYNDPSYYPEFTIRQALDGLNISTNFPPSSTSLESPFSPGSPYSGYDSSDSGSLQSPEHRDASPVTPWHTGDILAVPQYPGRGRALQRPHHHHYEGFSRFSRSPSTASTHSSDGFGAMCMPQPHHFGPQRHRSSSVAGSIHGDLSDYEGPSLLLSPGNPAPGLLPSPFSPQAFSPREHSPAPSHFSDSQAFSDFELGDLSSDYEGSSSAQSKSYRPTVGSKAIANASASRRKKTAKFFCKEPGCSSSFTTAQNLVHHLNSHAGVKPFKCKHAGCTKSFGTPHVANRHSHSCPKNKQKQSGNSSTQSITLRRQRGV